jgi:hypothetical protein
MTVGRLLGPEGHWRYLVGEHRSTVAVPVTNAHLLHPCRPNRDVRHRARGARERWRSEDSQVARAAAAVSLGDPRVLVIDDLSGLVPGQDLPAVISDDNLSGIEVLGTLAEE